MSLYSHRQLLAGRPKSVPGHAAHPIAAIEKLAFPWATVVGWRGGEAVVEREQRLRIGRWTVEELNAIFPGSRQGALGA